MPQASVAMMEKCVHTCHECQDQCLKTIVNCLKKGGQHASLEHQTLLANCVEICGVSHNLLHRQSSRHVHTCRACAAICSQCADHCERMAQSDEVMNKCVKFCHRCAQSCNEMASSAA